MLVVVGIVAAIAVIGSPTVLHEFKTFCLYRNNYNQIIGVLIPKLKREAKVSMHTIQKL